MAFSPLIALIGVAAQAAIPPAVQRSMVRVSTEGASDELRIELLGDGHAVSCPSLVARDRPCHVFDGPVGWADLSVHGSRTFQQQIELLPGPNTIHIAHRGHGALFAGLAFVAAGALFVAKGGTGPTITEDSTYRTYLDVGAIAIAVGGVLILNDLLRRHDLVEVSSP